MKITGLEASMKNLKGIEKLAFEKAGAQALRAAAIVLRKDLKANTSLRDHSLKQLAKLDHPYARRHGSISIHSPRSYKVHAQTGRMRSKAKFTKKGRGKKISYKIGFDYGAVPYARYVIQGTRVMLPRNTVYLTAMQPETRKAMMKAIVRVMGAELRTGAALRFGV
tara:strand:- start:222 stop:719 length:498 start_codon:yes stop_codon:yes gene_type:complete